MNMENHQSKKQIKYSRTGSDKRFKEQVVHNCEDKIDTDQLLRLEPTNTIVKRSSKRAALNNSFYKFRSASVSDEEDDDDGDDDHCNFALSSGSENESDDECCSLLRIIPLKQCIKQGTVPSIINGVSTDCHLSCITEVNLLQEDVWQNISENAAKSIPLDTEQRSKFKTDLGTYIKTVGVVTLPAKINFATYELKWTVVPVNTIPVKACVGKRLFQLARVTFENGKAVVKPRVITVKEPQLEEMLQQEFSKLKTKIGDRIEDIVQERRKKLAAHMKVVFEMVRNEES